MRILNRSFIGFMLSCLVATNALAASKIDYCPARLDARQQDEIFERVLNVGASFTHGCVSCDYMTGFDTFHRLTNDGNWIRRNPILTFLLGTPWKNERLTSNDFIAIYEHDSDNDISASIRLQNRDYYGYWGYFPQFDTATLLSPNTIAKLNQNVDFSESVKLLDGPRRPNLQATGTHHGVLYQWLAKQNDGSLKTRPFSLMDLANDGGRMHEFIRSTSNFTTFDKLYRSGWRDEALREKIIEESVAGIVRIAPSSVIVFDALFWDAIVESFAYLYQQKPSSLVLKAIKPFIGNQSFGADMDDSVKRDNIRADFFEILKRTSHLSSRHGRLVPVFLARLLDDPLGVFQQPKMEQALASLAAQVVYRLTGEDYAPLFRQGLADARATGSVGRQVFPFLPFLDRTPSFADDALGGVEAGRLGFPVRSVVNLSIQNAVTDLPLFMEGFQASFNKINRAVDTLKADDSHNIQIINASVFYRSFPNLLNPESSHPSVLGSRVLANTLEWELCQ